MNIFKHLIFITILFITACDPAQEISANFVLPTCPVGERYFEFTNIAPITFTLPPAPEVGCSITYAMYKNTVTFNGALLTIKGDGLSVATSLEIGRAHV